MSEQYVAELRVPPIPAIPRESQEPIIALVDQILAAKKADPKADTSALERQIDALVYELYGLTQEGIAVVEERS
jgi:adenine-specific DNA-methyltransferase